MFPSNIRVQKLVMWKENVSSVMILLGVLLIVQSVFAPFPKTLQALLLENTLRYLLA